MVNYGISFLDTTADLLNTIYPYSYNKKFIFMLSANLKSTKIKQIQNAFR